MAELDLSYNGNNLPENITQQLIDYARKDLNVPPSYLITKLHYEGLWGGSVVGQSNNNWGGMTWNNSWSNPYKRPSGVTVTRGSQRPSIEGGYYIRYDTVQDFLVDWSYLIRRGGIYNVANSSTFDEAVKGMFIYGGAQADYATMNVTGTKQRYELYLVGMKVRRTAINNANNGILDILDNEDVPQPEPPEDDPNNSDKWTYETILEKTNKILDSMLEKNNIVLNEMLDRFNNFEDVLLEEISKSLKSLVFKYNSSDTIGNDFIVITKLYNNMYKIEPNNNFKIGVGNIVEEFNERIDELKEELKNEINQLKKEMDNQQENSDPEIPQEDLSKLPAFPTSKGLKVTSKWGWRQNPTGSGQQFHGGTDWGGGGKTHPIYCVQDGSVTVSQWSNSGGWMVYIKHNHPNDNNHSRYLHLHEKPLVNVGDSVKKGQRIGTMGTTGDSTGIHLHLEISPTGEGWNTEQGTIDPEIYLKTRF